MDATDSGGLERRHDVDEVGFALLPSTNNNKCLVSSHTTKCSVDPRMPCLIPSQTVDNPSHVCLSLDIEPAKRVTGCKLDVANNQRGMDETDQSSAVDLVSCILPGSPPHQYYYKTEETMPAVTGTITDINMMTVGSSLKGPQAAIDQIRTEDSPSIISTSSAIADQTFTGLLQTAHGGAETASGGAETASGGAETSSHTSGTIIHMAEKKDLLKRRTAQSMCTKETISKKARTEQESQPDTEINIDGRNNTVVYRPASAQSYHYNYYGNHDAPRTLHASHWGELQTDGANVLTDDVASSLRWDRLSSQIMSSLGSKWKMFARFLCDSERCPNLESDLIDLDSHSGTVTEKMTAWLKKWAREHPQQGDVSVLKKDLTRALDLAELKRLAQNLDKYL